jgi:hypothetical protein
MPGRTEPLKPEVDYQLYLVLERIACALERANDLNSAAAEINAFNLKQLLAATQGGVIAAPGQILRK